MIGMSMITQQVLVLVLLLAIMAIMGTAMIILMLLLMVLLLVTMMIIGMIIMVVAARSPSPRPPGLGLPVRAASRTPRASLPHPSAGPGRPRPAW